ncbi:MAG: phage late control D family protein [Planctomycetota bacterium]|nr:MAG: phage late control D family protein [Planctomycetota bacterium]
MSKYEPFLQVKVEGVDVSKWVTSLSLTEDDRRVDHGVIQFVDRELVLVDSLQEGAMVEVDLGYNEAGKHATVFKGYIMKSKLNISMGGLTQFQIFVLDESIKMGWEIKRVMWDSKKVKKVSDIVKKIVSASGLSIGRIEIKPDPVITDHMTYHQYEMTDLTYLQYLAQETACKCFVEYEGSNKFYFVPEDAVLREVTEPLVYADATKTNLLDFQASYSYGYVQHHQSDWAVDPHTGKVVSHKGENLSGFPDWGNESSHLSEVKQWDSQLEQAAGKLTSKTKSKRKSLEKTLKKPRERSGWTSRTEEKLKEDDRILKTKQFGYNARGRALGNFELRAKSTVEIKGVGQRFSGKWYIHTVTHKIDSNGYQVYFECSR